ncbi:hypothetical protein KsCSTR_18350 [Candidatus Kuenenia stuttgartiensis]|uniref:Uncharacterized protein n=1 Tax=Kuenenia stuttgartiensis TaxID=174633 RepID=A0A6G7GPC9_KUEST|nr:hypothetical protein [Candidatus Kuenenia stuttgartiensis]QII11214.1 hypothetical protein KsCSTR_18350 [Candidatus Kuenenia stuttgartiensis]
MEMEKEYYLKAGEVTGIVKMVRLQKILAEAMEYIRIKEAIDGGVYKAYGMKAKEYCEEKCGIPYSTYNKHEAEIRQLGKDLWVMKKLMGWSADEVQSLAVLPEDSKVKVHEKSNMLELDGKKIPLENKAEIQEAFNAILKREELTAKEKQVAEKETKHAQKSLEGIGKEYKKEIKAYEDKVRDLEAKVVDPMLPEGFEEVMKSIERKFDEIHTAVTKLKYDDVYGDDPEEGHKRAMFAARVGTMRNQYLHALHRLSDVFGVNLEDIVNRARNV